MLSLVRAVSFLSLPYFLSVEPVASVFRNTQFTVEPDHFACQEINAVF